LTEIRHITASTSVRLGLAGLDAGSGHGVLWAARDACAWYIWPAFTRSMTCASFASSPSVKRRTVGKPMWSRWWRGHSARVIQP